MRSGGLLGRIAETLEQRAGVAVRSTATVERLEVSEREYAAYAAQAEEMAFVALDYFNSRPQEFRPERRALLAQRSRIAFMQDPLAGREIEMLADFAFGKGISQPRCKDKAVQDLVDDAWTDASNQEQLTSFQAQRANSADLKTQANLLALLFEGGGLVRVSWLNFDDVLDVVVDPENHRRVVWYVARERTYEWNAKTHSPAFSTIAIGPGGVPKVKYFPHWRNLDLAEEERANDPTLKPLPKIEAADIGVGKVFHLAINKLGEQHFGVPPFARSLRFYSAMNQFTESRVTMAQAASQFIAKRVVKGGPGMVRRQAEGLLNARSELGSRELGGSGDIGRRVEESSLWGARQPPAAPGSIWNENQADTLQSLSLNSGGSQAQADAMIIRAPIAASSGFGQHYLGDASNANLATATTLELPVSMLVQTWQQYFHLLNRWFVERVIEAAINAGKLGGFAKAAEAVQEGLPGLGSLCLSEAFDTRHAEKITGKDLSFSFEMPYPGRRALPDVAAYTTQTLLTFDPMGTNLALRRGLLAWTVAQGMQIDDVAGFVDEVFPPGVPLVPLPDAGPGNPLETAELGKPARLAKAQTTSPMPAKSGPNGKPAPTGTGAKQTSTPPDKVKGTGAMQQGDDDVLALLPPDLAEHLRAYTAGVEGLFDLLVQSPAVAASLTVAERAAA